METFRKLSDHYEVVGIAEPDPELRKRHENHPAYRGVPWMTEEQLLKVEGLQAVAVEVSSGDDRIMDVTGRCIAAGMHVHLDKPGGKSFAAFKRVLDEAGRRKLAVQLGYMYRNNPAVQFCQRAVREGVARADLRDRLRDERHARSELPKRPRAVSRRIDVHLRLPPDRPGGEPDGKARPHRLLPAANADGRRCRYVRQRVIVFEYPKTTVTIRTASLEVEGNQRRQLVVCGDQGTVDIRPLERSGPLTLRLALSEARDTYKKGYQEVSFPPPPGRYDFQLIELARIIRGEIENPYPLEHELLVQQCLLEACGYPLTGTH